MNPQEIFNIKTQSDFELAALSAFQYQMEHNAMYRQFCDLLGVKAESVKTVGQIPFLPIQFFKEKKILASQNPVETIFTSSGTTGTATSKHYVTDLNMYEQSFTEAFRLQYGRITDYTVLALLPSYLERSGSSLIYMTDHFIKDSGQAESGFYLDKLSALSEKLKRIDQEGKKILLIGVSFALLDLIETYSFNLKNTIVMETGGMKGRRKELVREELHALLRTGFGVGQIHSEYGMTELLSQAYSTGDGIFTTPPWMQIHIRDTEDALSHIKAGKTGGINIIDLANWYSCPFISTQDLGRNKGPNQFEVLGRFDQSDIRGCNLMVL